VFACGRLSAISARFFFNRGVVVIRLELFGGVVWFRRSALFPIKKPN